MKIPRTGEMSSSMAVLGLVVQQPDTIAGVAYRLSEVFPRARWSAGAAHSNMRSLAKQGLLQVVQEGSMPTLDRYEATHVGVAEFRRWLVQSSSLSPALRDALQARLEFVGLEELSALLETVRRRTSAGRSSCIGAFVLERTAPSRSSGASYGLCSSLTKWTCGACRPGVYRSWAVVLAAYWGRLSACRRSMSSTMDEVLLLSEVSKSYWRGGTPHAVLRDVTLRICPGTIVAVVGERHEGKTTLLKIAAGIQRPDHGRVIFAERDLWTLSTGERERLWGDRIAWTSRTRPGLDWEMRDYVGLQLAMGRSRGRRGVRAQAVEALERVGGGECAERSWVELSDWQRILVGLARGIVSRPRLLVIDDLFDGLGLSRMQTAGELLESLTEEFDCGVLMSSSGMEAALMADTVWLLGDKRLGLMSDQTRATGEILEFPTAAHSGRGSRGTGS